MTGESGSSGELSFGVMLPTIGPPASAANLRRVATAAERFGYDTLWAGDHVVFPTTMSNTYPFTDSGEPPAVMGSTRELFGVVETLAFLAGETTDIRVGTNVCLAPLRHPVALTKRIFTLAALSEGRLEFGVGLGWLPEEYEVLGVPFEERGARLDEFLDVFERARTDGEFAFDGPHHSFPSAGFHPVPETGPRIWVGGKSGATFRRVAEYGDGWTTVRDSPAAVASARDRVENAWADYDRTGTPEIALLRPVEVADGGSDRDGSLAGSPAAVREDVEAYHAAGVTHVGLMFYTLDVDEQIRQLERFATEVIPDVRPA